MTQESKIRPHGVTALSIFFALGAMISFSAAVALLFPNSFFEPMWRLNPHARAGFASMGSGAIVLMVAVCVCCAAASFGMWRGARWGLRIAVTLIAINLIGDVANTVMGTEPRAIVGVPIVTLVLWYLVSKRVRVFFAKKARLNAN